jgi:hypothetical protein
MDIGDKIEMLRVIRNETPFPAATPSAPPRGVTPATETIQQAKRLEFPVVPAAAAPKKKTSKLSAKVSSYKQ